MFGSIRQLTKFRAPISTCFATVRVNSTAVKSEVLPKWDLIAAVCVERPPYITPALSDMENNMVQMLDKKEFEESMLNDHETRHKRDMEKQERKKRGEEIDDGEAVVTALDLEDSWKKTAEGFTAASRTTPADETADLKSVKRKMDKPLRLLAKYKLGTEIHWDLPFIVRTESETLKDTAERAIKQRVGDNLDVKVLGNAPWSFYKYKYPKHYQQKTEKIGAKVWFFKGVLMNNFHDDVAIDLEEGILDYQWATRTEMEELLDKDLYKAIDNMLHEEEE